ncbi:hypothetical protein CJ202_08230 [Corynebacterium parakroppenstedtii]|nr:hypothetical protein HMPREF1861_02229 [Corynebacterium kroppenstedtii]PMC66148.1 hypothetical protein CJ202_08230 [Corynebacterium kroppenstedtii]
MLMNKKYAFTFLLAVFYAICTAMTAGSQLVENINENTVKVIINSLLLVSVAVVSIILVAMFQRKRSPVKFNRVSILSFTAIYVIAVLISGLPLSTLLFPACMLGAFIAVPSYQNWLKSASDPL